MRSRVPTRGVRAPIRAAAVPPPGPAGNDAEVAARRSLGQVLRGRLASARQHVRRRGRSAFFRAARLTGAAVAAYLVAEAVGLDDPPPLVAALTALLVVQATASSTLSSGVERVLSVVAGVALAVAFSALVGLTWWSLAILVAASIVVGQLLRLGPNLIEVPISAMLVLGVGYAVGGPGTRAEPGGRDPARRGGRGAGQRDLPAGGAQPLRRSGRPASGRGDRRAARRGGRGDGRRTRRIRRDARPTRATSSRPAPAGSRSRRSTAPPATAGSRPRPPAAGWTTPAVSTGTSHGSTGR